MKIVIDMLGGDNGLEATIPGTQEFFKKHKDIELYLCGNEEKLASFANIENCHIVNATHAVAMDVDPLTALKDIDSSLMVGIKTYLENGCDALISAGSTGALLSAATLKIKRLPGVVRPGLITSMPTVIKGKKFVAIDLGANTVNTSEELCQFAVMGSLYYKYLYKYEGQPRVYQLNIGTESEKGSAVNKETYELLKNNKSINFMGNMEGREPLFGECDVLVTDGYSGNIFLKTMEGTAKAMSSMLKGIFKKNLKTKIGYLLTKKGVNEMKDMMDYKKVGGAMLVGVNGIVIKAHGSSDTGSFLSALEAAYSLAKEDIVNKFKEELSK